MDFFTVKPRLGIDWHAPAAAPKGDTCRIASQNGLFRLAKRPVLACKTARFATQNGQYWKPPDYQPFTGTAKNRRQNWHEEAWEKDFLHNNILGKD